MTIKDANGNMVDVASANVAGWGLGTGIAGTALGLMNNGGLGGLFGGGAAMAQQYATKEALQMSVELAKKESEIARLMADKETDKKLSDVFKAAADRDVIFRDRLEAQYRELEKAITDEREARMRAEAGQSVLNSQYQSGLDILGTQQRSMAQTLAEITTSVIPSRKVCDTGCCGCAN